MKIPRELDEKLRRLLTAIDGPCTFTKLEKANDYLYRNAIAALQLRAEIIEILNSKPIKGKYKQLDLEEEVNKVKRNENY